MALPDTYILLAIIVLIILLTGLFLLIKSKRLNRWTEKIIDFLQREVLGRF